MTNTTRLSFEATADLVQRMHDHSAPVRRERVGSMEVVCGMISPAGAVTLVIDGVTGESVQLD
jgi:hypothetical protein